MPKTHDRFAETFAALRAILEAHAQRMTVTVDEPGHYELASPTMTDRVGRPLFCASVQINKNYVSYHLMPVYSNKALRGCSGWTSSGASAGRLVSGPRALFQLKVGAPEREPSLWTSYVGTVPPSPNDGPLTACKSFMIENWFSTVKTAAIRAACSKPDQESRR
jgi:hypothetical protein